MGVKYFEKIFSEVIADFIRNNPELSMPEIRQKLYISPQTDAGKIWNALVLKMTT
jgi:hypothetical protein